jgi:hypothetical protein
VTNTGDGTNGTGRISKSSSLLYQRALRSWILVETGQSMSIPPTSIASGGWTALSGLLKSLSSDSVVYQPDTLWKEWNETRREELATNDGDE